MTKRFRKAFAPHPSPKYDTAPVNELADEIVYVCGSPMFDNIIDRRDMFEDKIVEAFDGDFDPELDVIVDFGDPLVFAMMVCYAAILCVDNDVLGSSTPITVGRYSRATNKYVTHDIWF